MSTKNSCKHPCDKCFSPGTNNMSLDEGDIPVQTTDITNNSYANTPSPSSIESTSTIGRSSQPRSKNEYHHHKRRYRHDKLFHYTHALNRQYIVTMTNILFQMQKEIYKLKRRTQHVEQTLANYTKTSHPIIRIPRLTKDEISTICIHNKQVQQHVPSTLAEGNETTSLVINNNNQPSNESVERIDRPTRLQTIDRDNPPSKTLTRFCIGCQRQFSHRSAFLRHIRRIHHGVYPTAPCKIKTRDVKLDIYSPGTPALTTDRGDAENEPYQVLVNEWDYGEGRLRPRRASKSKASPESLNKVKCDICNKFFRAEYIKKHKRRTHRPPALSPGVESNNKSEHMVSTTVQSVESVQTPIDESPTANTNPPSTITVADMDVDDTPIQFRRESNKALNIATTCLQRDQIEIFEEFLDTFSTQALQSPAVNSRTTHLIINDDLRPLRSPLSMKLIEGVANHCYCVSYRWLIDCLKYERIIDEAPYEIQGDDTDNRAHGGPQRARLIEKKNSLFEKIGFMIKCSENNDIRMTNDRLESLITTCGGEIITCVTQSIYDSKDAIVVICDKAYVSERRHNYDECHKLGIRFVSSDWVLESILEYQVKDFSSYEETPF